MSTHTPGPWLQEDQFISVGPPTGQVICDIDPFHSWPKEIAVANARLIASAPELLEALKVASRMLLQTDWRDDDEAMGAITHAIAKAERKVEL